jgi:Raf kinase inhibitor-like YbhB/YbcL family protein
MKITSSVFNQGETIPSKYTCDRENINPPLEISDVPSNAQSLALIMDDPDAPAGTFTHWIVWNVNPDVKVIKENGIPEGGEEGMSGFGKKGYGGPCPHSGTHRYFFRIYALDTKLDLSSDTDKAGLEKAMENHILTQAELFGLYTRK